AGRRRRQQAVAGQRRLAAHVHEEERPGAVGALGLAGGEGALAEQGRLLVAGHARQGQPVRQEAQARRHAEVRRAGPDLRKQGPPAWRARQNSAVRRSCQTMARATGDPLSRSQRTVVSRWLVTPTAARSDGATPAAARASGTTAATERQISSASCSTQPGRG